MFSLNAALPPFLVLGYFAGIRGPNSPGYLVDD